MWQNLFDTLLGINLIFRNDIIILISKTQVLEDPKLIISEFQNLFSQRRILLSMICNKEQINLPLQRVLLVLQSLKDLEINEIKSIFDLDELQWLREINKIQQINNQTENQEKYQKLFQNIYQIKTQDIPQKDRVSIEVLIEISNKLETICDNYKHSYYQSMVSAAILSNYLSTIQVHLPTSSGKTWVEAIITEYWLSKNFTVLIIVPNEILKEQFQRQLFQLGPNLNIQTIKEYYQDKKNYQIIIVDEYDYILQNNPYDINSGKIVGFWDFTVTNCYLFSATFDQALLRIFKKIFGSPAQLEFQSELEVVTNIKQDQGGDIEIFQSEDEKNQFLLNQIKSLANSMPIIIFMEKKDHSMLENKIQNLQIKNFAKGISLKVLDEILTWKAGLLLLSPEECVGYKTRFKQDAKLIISCDIEPESQYLQMRGRGSRTRGVLQSLYIIVSKLTKAQIILGLKNLSIKKLNELVKLLEVIFKKRNSKILIEALTEAFKCGDNINTLKDLQQLLGDNQFKKLTQNMK